ncbi:methyltransferase [Streptomyces formicae]|uniref:O-methyltransferase n=2 Tax=Streptomyces TaxID=1883 RepID=A0A291QJR9_9ACTN|nr:methyltransferase [Streptomyces formicae]AQP25571.1 O-methyltransferase [Streptomyces sp. KY5]ATL31693.1 O-methyltransferase [Streptomyces formicae]
MTAQEQSALLTRVSTGSWLIHALNAVARLGVPDVLDETPRPVEEFAPGLGADADALGRTLRALAALDFFTEGPRGHFALNESARLLRADAPAPLRAFLSVGVERVLPLFGELEHTLRTGRPAAEKIYGMPYFDYLDQHPDTDREFTKSLGRSGAAFFDAALDRMELDGTEHLVDLGGGDGAFVELALRRHPRLTATLLDRPAMLGAARERMGEAGLTERCALVGGSFFDDVPTGGDVYCVARCLHNWDDDTARTLLRTVRTAMGPGARLMIVEDVVPEGPATATAGYADLVMMLIGGRERTLAEYEALLGDARFTLTGARPIGTVAAPRLHLVEAAPVTQE